MGAVKKFGMLFLAIYLILTGFMALSGMAVPMYVELVRELSALVAGILILVSMRSCGCKVCDNNHSKR